MSHLARELHRQLWFIERQAKDLMQSVQSLLSDGNLLMSGTDGWDEAQAGAIRTEIHDHADECDRRISQAQAEVDEFRQRLAGSG
ncbi:hypothetical protein FKR81_37700 [Lentzea tibetensis]|uniref:Uncharacterized protein n=1 Tax=Lentzea tibetensis TaxID=2591470 RepID=A0A563EIW1_9PSEU|nr:hypothetical protein [Lentzea tibetensis]TWP45959.1 hypothetical protein FKR81_37700 [Lentzea tibetensis]